MGIGNWLQGKEQQIPNGRLSPIRAEGVKGSCCVVLAHRSIYEIVLLLGLKPLPLVSNSIPQAHTKKTLKKKDSGRGHSGPNNETKEEHDPA